MDNKSKVKYQLNINTWDNLIVSYQVIKNDSDNSSVVFHGNSLEDAIDQLKAILRERQ